MFVTTNHSSVLLYPRKERDHGNKLFVSSPITVLQMNRREMLLTIGATAATSMAGCIGGCSGDLGPSDITDDEFEGGMTGEVVIITGEITSVATDGSEVTITDGEARADIEISNRWQDEVASLSEGDCQSFRARVRRFLPPFLNSGAPV